MDKKQILASLNNIANDLDQKSEFEHSDKITNLMIKISQMPIKQAGFMDALSTIGSGLYEAAGSAVQGFQGIGSALPEMLTDAGGMGARNFLNSQFNQKLQNDKVYREKEQMRIYVENETKKIIDEITHYIKTNKNTTSEAAKQQAINKAQIHPYFQQINAYTTTYNKMNFADVITTKFDTYVANLFPEKNIEVKPNAWVPPVEKY